jgi:hypothetical protein
LRVSRTSFPRFYRVKSISTPFRTGPPDHFTPKKPAFSCAGNFETTRWRV